jgi:hypothetical protein
VSLFQSARNTGRMHNHTQTHKQTNAMEPNNYITIDG